MQQRLAKRYQLGYLPINSEDYPGLYCKIDEVNLKGLFGENGSLDYVNKTLSMNDELIGEKIHISAVVGGNTTECEFEIIGGV